MAEGRFNFDELLAPIPGGEPAGPASAFYELRSQFEEMRREVTPDRDSPVQGESKVADWRSVERKAREALAETSKDLRLACYLLEALVRTNGFAGAHDGLKLLRLLVEQCWDRLNPPADPEDAEVRAAPFNWIDDPDFGLRFPTTLRLAPLLIGADKTYSYNDCRPQAKDEAAQTVRVEVDRAVATVPPANLTAVLTEVRGALEELQKLTAELSAKLGAAAPTLNTVRQVLEECRTFLEQILQKRPDAAAKTDTGAVDGAPAGAAPGAATSRAEIYRQLEQAALALRDLEPHSPIPYLLLRAVELGKMPFPTLMVELVREPVVLTQLRRELGIKEPPAAPTES